MKTNERRWKPWEDHGTRKRDEAKKKYLDSGGQISTKELAAAGCAGKPHKEMEIRRLMG